MKWYGEVGDGLSGGVPDMLELVKQRDDRGTFSRVAAGWLSSVSEEKFWRNH
jgi:hypothetical protein